MLGTCEVCETDSVEVRECDGWRLCATCAAAEGFDFDELSPEFDDDLGDPDEDDWDDPEDLDDDWDDDEEEDDDDE